MHSTQYQVTKVTSLQTDLLTLQKWCKTWQMEFNLTKCEHLQITNKYNFIDTNYTLYGHTIQKLLMPSTYRNHL